MKQLLRIIIAIVIVYGQSFIVNGQVPAAIPYQAVARDVSGNLISSQNISLRFSIHDGTAAGTVVYKETQTTTTNALGLFSVNIGQGTVVTGTFAGINWGSGAKFTQVEMDATGGNTYVDMGTQQMMSVPYAQYAGNGMPAGTSPGNMLYWNGSQWLTVSSGINGQTLFYCNGIPQWGPCTPTVTTNTPSQVSFTSAFSGGNVTNDGGSSVTSRGICWNTSPNPTIANFFSTNGAGTGTGTFLVFALNLTPNTTYYLRAFATNAAGTSYGSEFSFTTLAATVPTINTQNAFSITTTGATSGGFGMSANGATITSQGICWSTNPNPTLANSSFPDFTLNPFNFTINMFGLTQGTTYYVRAYATNSVGTGYGNQMTFNTLGLSVPSLTTTAMSGITSTTAVTGGNVTYDGGSTVTARGICYNTSPNPTTANTIISGGTGTGSFTSNITGLTINTTYYVRAYATNSTGTAYGSQVTFTTSPYTLGQSFGGGIIYYIDGSNGQHGLIAASTDGAGSGSINWYFGVYVFAGGGTAIYTGSANTTAIINAMGSSTLAQTCRNYTGGGFNDWYLPALDEQSTMYQNRSYLGNYNTNTSYWTSSMFSSSAVYIISLGGTQTQVQYSGISIYSYRPVRAF